jgi:hypothetical protein
MRQENDDWILVYGSDPEAIRKAITKHSGLARHVQPSTHRVSIFRVDAGRFGIRFDPKLPPYAFTNLIGWLDDPRMTSGSSRAVGWFRSPGTSVRYYLAPRAGKTGGDTLLGLGDDGSAVAVYLPDCGLSRSSVSVEPLPEPRREPVTPLLEFQIEADDDQSFGNPNFVRRPAGSR